MPHIAVGVSVIAVKLGTEGKSRVVGLSCVDVVSTLILVAEFQDNESFSNLESLIVTLAPKECLLIQGDGSYEFQILKQLLERNNVMVILRKRNEFSSDSIIDDLNTLIKFKKGQKENAQSLPEVNLNLAMSATSGLIKYLDLTSDEGHMNQFSLKQVEQSRYIRLPQIDGVSNLHGNLVASVLTLSNKCRTAQGRRLIAQCVRQPLRDLSLIKEKRDIVELLVNNNELRSILNDEYLKRIPNLQQLAKKLDRKKSALQNCYKIYLCVSYLPKLLEQLSPEANVTALKAMIIDPLKKLIEDMDKFQQLVERRIDLDAAKKGDFMVNPGLGDDFKELKDAMDEIEEGIQQQLGKAADDLGMKAGKTLKLESNQQLGYYFRITLKNEKILRNNKRYTILDSNKAVRFRNSKLSELNDEFIVVRNKYLERQKYVITKIMGIAAGYSETVRTIGGVLAYLDVLTAFASVAISANKVYVRPEMVPSEEGELNLIQVRHPCLEMQQGVDYIANDIKFKRGMTVENNTNENNLEYRTNIITSNTTSSTSCTNNVIIPGTSSSFAVSNTALKTALNHKLDSTCEPNSEKATVRLNKNTQEATDLEIVLRELNILNLKVDDISESVNALLKATADEKSSQKLFTCNNNVPDFILSFPVNEESLARLEDWLMNSGENKTILAENLSRIEGCNVKEVVRRIMDHVFTNEVGMAYSWEGTKKKKIFKNLAVASSILSAVRLNKNTQEATDSEIIYSIKAWLVRSKDRFDNNNKNKNIAQTDERTPQTDERTPQTDERPPQTNERTES